MTIIGWLSGTGHSLSTGAPNASGRLSVLSPGTQSIVPVFDANGETLSQPIELDAAGKADVYVDGPVDLAFEDSTGAAIQTMSFGNLQGADSVLIENSGFTGTLANGSQGAGGRTYLDNVLSLLKASFGGVDAMVQESGSAVPRALVELLAGIQLSVRDFGAKGDGLSIDTTYIQLALNRCSARGGGLVYLDPGTYLIDAAITIPSAVSLIGAGSGVSILKCNGAAQNCITMTGAGGNNVLEGFGITHASTSTGTGISVSSRTKVSLRDISVTSGLFAKGVQFSACSNTAIYDSYLGCTSAGASRALIYSTSGINHFVQNVAFTAGAGTCVELATGQSSIAINCCNFVTGSVGVLLTSADGNDQIRVTNCAGLATNMSTPFSETPPASSGLYQTGNLVDGYETTVTSGGTFTPSPILRGPNIRVQATSTGVAYIVAALPTLPISRSFIFTIEFFNNAAGPVTGWTLNAMYHVAAAIPTADLAKTRVTFAWDFITSVAREIARAQTT